MKSTNPAISLTLLSVLIAGTAQAGSFNGFISLSYGSATDNSYYDIEEDGSHLMIEGGLNGRASLAPWLDVSGQLIYRNKGNATKEELRVDYLNLDFSLGSMLNGEHHLLAGRIKNPMGLYGETLDVPFSRPTIILPQSIYNEATRNLIVSGDGGNLKSFYSFSNHSLETNIMYARTSVDDKFAENMYADEGETIEGKNFFTAGAKLDLGGSWLLGYDFLSVEFEHFEVPESAYDAGFFKQYRNYGYLRYSAERWEFSAEYMYQRTVLDDLLPKNLLALSEFTQQQPALPDIVIDQRNRLSGDSGYVQFTYYLTPQVNLYLVHDVVFRDVHDRSGRESAEASAQLAALSDAIRDSGGPDFGLVPATRYSNFQKTWTFGVSWQPDFRWQLMAEYHDIKGTANMPPLINKENELSQEYSSIFVLQASYRF